MYSLCPKLIENQLSPPCFYCPFQYLPPQFKLTLSPSHQALYQSLRRKLITKVQLWSQENWDLIQARCAMLEKIIYILLFSGSILIYTEREVWHMLISKVPKILWDLINKFISNIFILRGEKLFHLLAVALNKSYHLITSLGLTTCVRLPGFKLPFSHPLAAKISELNLFEPIHQSKR